MWMLSKHFHYVLKTMKQIIDASPFNCALSLNSQKHNNITRISKYSQPQGVIFGVVMCRVRRWPWWSLQVHSDSGCPMILWKFVLPLAADSCHLCDVPDHPLFAFHLKENWNHLWYCLKGWQWRELIKVRRERTVQNLSTYKEKGKRKWGKVKILFTSFCIMDLFTFLCFSFPSSFLLL